MIKVSHVYKRILEDLAVPGHNHKHGRCSCLCSGGRSCVTELPGASARLDQGLSPPSPLLDSAFCSPLHHTSSDRLHDEQMAPTPTDGTDDTAGLHGVSAAPVSIQEVDAALQDLQMAPAPTDSTYGTAGPHGGAEGGATDINSRAATTRGQDNTVVSALFTRPEQVLQVSPTEVHDEDQNQQQQQKVTKICHP
ncbi:hypothetical protein SEVIR_1G238201v4 [Setaria viridis]|uniref:Uncharacterized protein n=1 Tax=Setaria viridis TaxID=4556 RepID=A0A4U6WF34_SETVI|nr:hypothetical protein SEVIR_1G238201v2 [Setaria viridis]TKW40326.1 hypothetical protein SEVIR_1G238201v2 [Setaria viridis]